MMNLQEDITNRTVAVSLRASKLTADLIKQAMRDVSRAMEKGKNKAAAKARQNVTPKGKQTIKSLMKSRDSLTSSEISKEMMKPFDKVARKYGITYAVTKEKGMDPPRYMIFFKAKDVDLITAAFQEFARTKYNIQEKGSVTESLEKIAAATKEKSIGKMTPKEPAKAAKKVLEKTLIPERTR